MTRIKKWLTMSALLIISLTITNINAHAVTYQAYSTPMSSQYSDFFENYFKDKHFTYFTYRCTYGGSERSCYYGIDNDTKQYINFIYTQVNTTWTITSQTGTDNSFNVTGATVVTRGDTFNENIDKNTKVLEEDQKVILYAFVFAFALVIVAKLIDDSW